MFFIKKKKSSAFGNFWLNGYSAPLLPSMESISKTHYKAAEVCCLNNKKRLNPVFVVMWNEIAFILVSNKSSNLHLSQSDFSLTLRLSLLPRCQFPSQVSWGGKASFLCGRAHDISVDGFLLLHLTSQYPIMSPSQAP